MGSDTKALTVPPLPLSAYSLKMFKKQLFSTIAIIYFLFSYFSLYTGNVSRPPGKVLQCLASATWRDLWKMRSHLLLTGHVQWACRQYLAKCKRLAKCKPLAKCKCHTKWPGYQCSCKTTATGTPPKPTSGAAAYNNVVSLATIFTSALYDGFL